MIPMPESVGKVYNFGCFSDDGGDQDKDKDDWGVTNYDWEISVGCRTNTTMI